MKKLVFLILIFSTSLQARQLTDFTLPIFSKKSKINLSKITKNQKVVINFWASWCTACIKELKELEVLKKNNPLAQFIAINAGETPIKIKRFLKKYKFSYTILVDKDKTYSKSIGVLGLPQTIVVGKNRSILYRSDKPPKDI